MIISLPIPLEKRLSALSVTHEALEKCALLPQEVDTAIARAQRILIASGRSGMHQTHVADFLNWKAWPKKPSPMIEFPRNLHAESGNQPYAIIVCLEKYPGCII